MKYWVYIKDKVEGPFDEDKLVTLNGFTPDTLLCSEDAANSGNQEWVKASAIFEFEQPAPAPAPAPAPTPASAPVSQSSGNEDMLAATLLAKLDAVNSQLTGLQNRIDGMQDELEKTIVSQQKAFQEMVERTDAMEAKMNTLSGQPFVTPKEQTLEDIAPQAQKTVPHETLSSVALSRPAGTDAQSADTLDPIDLDKGGDDQELGFDLNPAQEEVVDEKENTFQDLLTPAQVEQLNKEAAAQQQGQPATEESADKKEALLSELTVESQKQDVLDQVIKEKAEEEEEKKSKTLRWLSAAGAAALAGTASLVGLKNKKNSEPTKEEQEPAPTQEPAPEPTAEAVPLVGEQPEQDAPAAVPSLDDVPTTSAAEPVIPEQMANPDVPGLDQQPTLSQEQPAPVTDAQAEQTIQELAPQAAVTEPEPKSDELITAEDLQEAFDENKTQDAQAADGMFGIPGEAEPAAPAMPEEQTQAQEPVTPAELPQEPVMQQEPSLADVSSNEPAESAMREGNPNDLTEIELKEGSTYLISDFVPPSSADAIPDALKQAQNEPVMKDTDLNVQEMVADLKQTDAVIKDKANEAVPASAQAILENTIKAKRGAALDIKTVPMVPEPAQSDRLQIEGMDDINTQHDIKSADVEPAGKTAKMVVGLFVIVLLAAVIYGMLAFMELIPPEFNLLNKLQGVTNVTQQDANLNEMLGPTQEPAPAQAEPAGEAVPQVASQDAILEEVQNYSLPNGATLKTFIEMKHPAAVPLITWEISTAVDPDNYSVLVKVPPENPQSFKISYRFNYNAVTKVLDPTISDAKNLLDSASAPAN